jgi:DNA-binding HxlR family transcriptional regulator
VSAPDPRKVARGILRFGSPWKLTVLAYLGERPLRFNEILRFGEGDGLNARTLSRVLKTLAVQGLVNREVIGTQPIAVQYSLTEIGRRMGRLLAEFQNLEGEPSLRDVQF